MDVISTYFPDLTTQQKGQLQQLGDLYTSWNAKINVVSRKDIDQLYERHVLHSLAIAKWIQFKPGTKIIDVGCGGGFPGIPLAILFPEVEFHLVDSVRKKLTVVNDISEQLHLSNVKTSHSRMEELQDKADFVVNRAVARLSKLLDWTQKLISDRQINSFPNGLIALKGGDLSEEVKEIKPRYSYVEQIPVKKYFKEDFFEEKYIIYVQK